MISSFRLVKKKTNNWRPCGDYRRRNGVTILDHYPVTFLHDSVNFLHGTSISFTVELFCVYQLNQSVKKVYPKPQSPLPSVFSSFSLWSSVYGTQIRHYIRSRVTLQHMWISVLSTLMTYSSHPYTRMNVYNTWLSCSKAYSNTESSLTIPNVISEWYGLKFLMHIRWHPPDTR